MQEKLENIICNENKKKIWFSFQTCQNKEKSKSFKLYNKFKSVKIRVNDLGYFYYTLVIKQ